MTQRSLFWDGDSGGAGVGDCGPYGQAQLMDRFFRCILNGTGNRGPVRGWRDELEASGATSPVSIAAGGVVVYGLFEDVDSAVSVSVPTPSAGRSRYDRIVARRSWANQQIRIGRISGVAAAIPAVPALVQTPGSIYDVPLATVLADDAGNLTLTDAREFCAMPTAWGAAIVGPGMYEQGAVGIAAIPNRTRGDLKGSNQIRPDASNPLVWTVGASYDYWEATDGATTGGWVYFLGPTGVVGAQVDLYAWSVPDVNGAGGGAENCQWDYDLYAGADGGALANSSGTTNVDQQARVNTTIYADQIVSGVALGEGQILAVHLSRDGAADSYNSDVRLLGIEMRWTADA